MTAATAPADAVIGAYAAALAAAGVDSPSIDLDLLIEHVCGVPAPAVRSGAIRPTDDQMARLGELVGARARRVPLQYITGVAHFRYLSLATEPGVFIPRPETEILAGIGLAELVRLREAGREGLLLAAEPCTGTGAIAIALANECVGVQVHASDVNVVAVELATRNASTATLAPTSVVEVAEADLLGAVPPEHKGHLDVLVSNPPYLATADLAACTPEVRDHEPHNALVGGPEGHEVVRRLLTDARAWLRQGGLVAIEIAENRGADAAALAREAGLVDVQIQPDLTGRDRFLVARNA